MLYMSVLQWAPDKRDAVIERSKKLGFEHEGMKVIGTWVDPSRGRAFQLMDCPPDMDPMFSLKATLAWSDLCSIDNVPVIEATEMMKILETMK